MINFHEATRTILHMQKCHSDKSEITLSLSHAGLLWNIFPDLHVSDLLSLICGDATAK